MCIIQFLLQVILRVPLMTNIDLYNRARNVRLLIYQITRLFENASADDTFFMGY